MPTRSSRTQAGRLSSDRPKAGTTDWKKNVSVVLVEPRESGNIGAAARALKNMGFTSLELVSPRSLTDEARWMACHAVDLVQAAPIHERLADALADKSLVVGATRRFGKQRGQVFEVGDAAGKIAAAAKRNRVAILFGREDKGLNNEETEQCDLLLTIPTDPVFPSLNLAQSVLLVAYELGRKSYRRSSPEFLEREELEPLFDRVFATLRLLEYVPCGNLDLEARIRRNLRRIIGRAGLTRGEMRMVLGLCAQVEAKLRLP
jgi:TrmH family RNA methyltransferase